MIMEPSYEKLLVRLADARVDFVVVGSLAVTLQGYVRFTEDIDILVDADFRNIRRLLDCLAGFGEGFARELAIDDFAEKEGFVRIVEEVEQCQIDVFTLMDGRRHADVAKDADVFELDGREIRYASVDTLLGWKEDSEREKDRLDALALRQLQLDPTVFD